MLFHKKSALLTLQILILFYKIQIWETSINIVLALRSLLFLLVRNKP